MPRRTRFSLQLLTHAAIHRFNEIVGAPGASVRAEAARVPAGWRDRFDLFQREALLHQIANAVSDDRHHVPVFDHVELIADAAVARNDQRALLAGHDRPGGNGRIDELLQGRDFTLNAAALRDIDYGESRRIQDVAGHDNIGAAKENHRIAIRVRRRLMEDFNALAVEVHILARLIEGFRWPGGSRKWRRLPAGAADSFQDLFGGKDRRSASQEIRGNAGPTTLSE